MTRNKLLKDRRLYVIFSITLVGVMGVASLTPTLPKISQALDLSKSEVALLISTFTFPGIFLTAVAVIGYSIGDINGVYYLSAIVALIGLLILFTMIRQQKIEISKE